MSNILRFGTSGLRALVSDMTDHECYVNTLGFLRFLEAEEDLKVGDVVYLAGDLRDSTPRIMRAVHQAVIDFGCQTVNCGLVPTPTVACYAFGQHAPSIMVTGSHIPADRNGIKFQKSEGEVMKADEAGIMEAVAQARQNVSADDISPTELPAIDDRAKQSYVERYTSLLDAKTLAGKKVVLYQHSSVGRDIMADILRQLGADVVTVGRTDTFVPIDTENVTPADQAYFKQLAVEHPDAFAIVSADGDADRPFVIDETSTFHRGDVLGAVTATYLQADAAAYPASTNDAVDETLSKRNIGFARTKIGSPYVIDAMNKAVDSGKQRVVGWEVNGGFLTANDIKLGSGYLPALPTRDAMLPIIAALHSAAAQDLKVSELFASLPQRYTQAGLLDNFPVEISKKLGDYFSQNTDTTNAELESYFSSDKGFGGITDINLADGIRISFDNSDVAHVRPSSNAPQLRIYSNADSQDRADEIVRLALAEPDGIFRRMEAALTSAR